MSGSLRSAFSSRFSRLRTSRPGGDDAVSLTIEVGGLDDTAFWRYQRTTINLQLSKNSELKRYVARKHVSLKSHQRIQSPHVGDLKYTTATSVEADRLATALPDLQAG